MQKLLTYSNGGHPASINDMEWLQSALFGNALNIIKGLVPLINDRFIVFGCNYAAGTLSSGVIFYDGKLFEVDSQFIAGTPSTLFFVIDETFGPYNPLTYADSTLKNVHTQRKLKLQAGSGLFSLASLPILRNLMQTNLAISDYLAGYATEAWVLALFSTLRNGYDPTFRRNPANSHLEWAYTSPSHPDAEGTAGNPWRDLGIVVGLIGPGTLGVFEANITTNKVLPFGYYGAYGTTLVRDILQYDTETDPNNAFFLLREYVAQVDGNYTFRHESAQLTAVSTLAPHTVPAGSAVTLNIAMSFNGDVPGLVGSLITQSIPVHSADVTIGDVISMPSIERVVTMVAGDTMRTLIWFEGASSTFAIDRNAFAANARAMWRLSDLNWFLV
jgi:hypothetical protein